MAVAARNRRLALVAAHTVLDPSLPESLLISRLPDWLVGGYRPLLAAPRLAARIAPELPVPLWEYLDLDRVCGQPETRGAPAPMLSGSDGDLAGSGADLDVVAALDQVIVGAAPVGRPPGGPDAEVVDG